MYTYVSELRKELENKGYDENYIRLCEEYCNRLLCNNLPVIFDLKHLSLLLGLKYKYLKQLFYTADIMYREITIPKRDNKVREISIPSEGLKFVQRWILDNILYKINISDCANGFIPNRSILNNAVKHVNNECVINVDIKDFFPSITIEQVYRIFNYHGYTQEISYILAKLCTYKGVLPQGAPTSPYISNIICLKLDKRINALACAISANYSRYADDITLSGNKYVEKSLDTIELIVNEEGFFLNKEKTRILLKHHRQEVTGLIVNDKVSVPRKLKRYLRREIYLCKRFGVNEHMERYRIRKSNYKDYLYGIAYFIYMVEHDVGQRYINELNEINWEF